MGQIKPTNPELLDDEAVDYSHFSCCGDEDLVFLKCPECGHIWVECFECSTWFVDLRDLDRRESSYLASDDQRVKCPECEKPFLDLHYLADDKCDRYLPTREEVAAAGHARLLADKGNQQAAAAQEQKASASMPRRQTIRVRVGSNKASVMGGAVGAAGWIIGLALATYTKGFSFEAGCVLLCGTAVMIVGFLLIRFAARGVLISLFHAMAALLMASCFFGTCALLFMASREMLDQVVDPDGEFSPIWNFMAPVIVLVMIGCLFIPPVKKYLSNYFV